MAPRLPDFFILGAGRCGTTSLWAALREHPQIFMSERKEPTFFSDSFQVVRNPVPYAALFNKATDNQITGEASHGYLTNPLSAPTLKAFFPSARFVLVFRNPADRALALYSFMVARGYEILPSFERALRAEERRYRSERFRRRSPHNLWNFMYYRSGLFGEQMARYLDLYPRDAFYVTTLYRLRSDHERVLGDIHEFLGVERRPPGAFPKTATSRGTRSIAVQYTERRLLRRLERRGLPGAAALHRRVNEWNRGRRPTMTAATRESLVDRFRPDLSLLESLTGCDVLADEAIYGAASPQSSA